MGALFAADQTEQDSVNFEAILESAGLANIAYFPETEIGELIHAKNYTLTLYRTIPENKVSYFIATNELTKTQVISIRGTSNIENTFVDISLKLTLDQHTGLRLHKGFSLAARRIYTDLQPHLKKNHVINTTGHSLGGAVALILAMYLDSDHFTIGRVTTFGQPKVTNFAGAKNFKHLNVVRVVTPLDLVPLVPPLDPLDIGALDIYWHTGKEVLLLSDNRYSQLEGLDSMLRVTKFTQKALTEENLGNHSMSFYIEMLNKKTQSAELVPYKNSFNIFNLFARE